jgi:DNA repair exonuclease SbcCD ATPase subunit
VVDEADWPTLREALANGERLPGEAWAEVEFNDQVDLDAFLGLERDGEPEALTAEVELGKAFELVDEGKGKIRKVFYRRRLIDAETLVHGSVVPGGAEAADLMTDGLAALLQRLQEDIAALEAANERLAASEKNVAAERGVVRGQADELSADLVSWERDVTAATRLAEAFEAEAGQAAKRLEAAEQAVVELGRQLDTLVGEAVRAIDQVAPPPPGRGAAAPAATF